MILVSLTIDKTKFVSSLLELTILTIAKTLLTRILDFKAPHLSSYLNMYSMVRFCPDELDANVTLSNEIRLKIRIDENNKANDDDDKQFVFIFFALLSDTCRVGLVRFFFVRSYSIYTQIYVRKTSKFLLLKHLNMYKLVVN